MRGTRGFPQKGRTPTTTALLLDNENHFVSRNYMRFLVWGMKSGNRGYAALESTLDHVIAKSIVLYTRKKPITARPY